MSTETQVIEEIVNEEIVSDGSPTQDNPPVEPPKQPQENSEIAELKHKIAKLENQNVNKEAQILKLRTRLSEVKQKAQINQEELRQGFESDPVASTRKLLEVQEAEREVKQLEREISLEELSAHNKQLISSTVPNFDTLIDGMVDILKSDGIPSDAVSKFKENPYACSIDLLINLSKRAESNKKIREYEEKLKSLSSKNPEDAIKNIENIANKKTLTNASGGGGSGIKTYTLDKSIYAMTNEELAAVKEKLK